MQRNPQRPLNSAIDPRNGAPKNISTENVPIKPGMTRQTSGDLHPYLHGQSVNDETADKLATNGKGVSVNPGTPSRPQRGQHVDGLGAAMLDEASRLGKPAITDPQNGRALDGGSRPVTSQD